jgi:TPR repeat protein
MLSLSLVVLMLSFLLKNYVFDKAILHLKEENHEYALYYLKPLAFVGYSEAQKILGECFAFGHGVEKNKEKAKYWLRRAHDGSDCNSDRCIAADLYFIGENYLEGVGVEINREEAMNWIKMAADNGYPKAVEYMSQPRSPEAR